jgi:DNA primase
VAAAPRQASGSDRVRRPRPLQGDSPVRKAVALLVQQPDLAASVADQPELPEAAIAGLDLLRGLLKLLQEAPKQNTGQVLEHYRGDPSEKHLEKLATWEHAQQASDNPQGELRDALLAVRIDALQRQEAAARELGDARAAEICAALQQEISRLKQQRLSGGG